MYIQNIMNIFMKLFIILTDKLLNLTTQQENKIKSMFEQICKVITKKYKD